MICSWNCPPNYSQMSDYNFADELEQYTIVYAAATFEEIVIVMISQFYQ